MLTYKEQHVLDLRMPAKLRGKHPTAAWYLVPIALSVEEIDDEATRLGLEGATMIVLSPKDSANPNGWVIVYHPDINLPATRQAVESQWSMNDFDVHETETWVGGVRVPTKVLSNAERRVLYEEQHWDCGCGEITGPENAGVKCPDCRFPVIESFVLPREKWPYLSKPLTEVLIGTLHPSANKLKESVAGII